MTLTKRGIDMVTIVSALVGLATVSVALRFAARMKLRLKFEVDDWLCLGALVCLLGMLVELILCMFSILVRPPCLDILARRQGANQQPLL